MAALRGCSVDGFPNLLFIIGPNTGLGNSSMILMIESSLNYVADYLRTLDRTGAAALDATTRGGRARWNERLQQPWARTVWNTGGCKSWYLDANGRNTTAWPGTTAEFRRATRQVKPRGVRDCVAPAAGRAAAPRGSPSGGGRPSRPCPTRPCSRDARLTAVSADGTRICTCEEHGPEPTAPPSCSPHGWTCSTLFWAAVVRATRRRPPGGRLRPARPRPQRGARRPRPVTAPAHSPTTWRPCWSRSLPDGRAGRARRPLHGRYDDHGRLRASGRPGPHGRRAAGEHRQRPAARRRPSVLPPRFGARWLRRAVPPRNCSSRGCRSGR